MSSSITSFNEKNKLQIARALATILDPKNNIREYIVKMLMYRLIWAVTEINDEESSNKYFGQPYWSHRAIERVNQNLRSKKPPCKSLRHEHVVPKKFIVAKILASDKSETSIYQIVNLFGHAVVVTEEEDKLLDYAGFRSTLPGDINTNSIGQIFCRYIKTNDNLAENAKIKIIDTRAIDIRSLDEYQIKSLQTKSII